MYPVEMTDEIKINASDQRRQRTLMVLRTINDVRKEHHACTAREVGRRLKLHNTQLQLMLTQLRKLGYIDSTELAGSLRVTAKGLGILSVASRTSSKAAAKHDTISED